MYKLFQNDKIKYYFIIICLNIKILIYFTNKFKFIYVDYYATKYRLH